MSPLRGALVGGGFAFDPAADPWGAAMLGAAALGVLALLVAMGRRFGGRRPGGSGWLLGFSSLAFLGIASTSAAQRARATPADSAPPPAPAEPVTIAAPAVERDEDDPPPPPDAETPKPDAGTVAPSAAEGSALPPTEALPSDPAERKAAVRAVLRNARRTYEDEDSCKSAKDVGKAWADLKASGASGARADAVARRLEECRRSVRWATTYVVHRDRVDARDAFAEALAKRLSAAHSLKTFIKLSGKNHERMRMGSGKLDDTLAAAIMTDALQAELTELGFERVILASGRSTWKTELEPRDEASYVADELRPFGLAAPLRLTAE